ncbi:MAG TPA: transcriptional regulator [Ignavibacteriales bacterium]|nr:transcriptional regulator [Ignavibacteriales bacterium]
MEKHCKSSFDKYIILKIKEKRIEKGLSQSELAAKLGVSSGFIGKIESLNTTSKYNLNHLNKLALIFSCSPKDFLPNNPIV